MKLTKMIAMTLVLASAFLFLPVQSMATTLGQGGILTSGGLDIEVLVLPKSSDLNNLLNVFVAFTQPNGPAGAGTFLVANSSVGTALCLWAAGATCGAGGFGGASGQAPIFAGPAPAAGAEIVFGIVVPSPNGPPLNLTGFTTYTVFTGAAARNPDGLTHNNNTNGPLAPDLTQLVDVAFEDLLGPAGGPNPNGPPGYVSDRDFNDTVYEFYGLQREIKVPEPASLLLLGLGLVGLSGVGRLLRRRD